MNIQGTSKVIAVTKDQVNKMKSAYTSSLDAMSLPTEPIAPVTASVTETLNEAPQTIESPVTNADLISQTQNISVTPVSTPVSDTLNVSEPNVSAMGVDELKEEMSKIEQEITAKNAKVMDLLDEMNADFIYHKQLVEELGKKLGLTKAPIETAPIAQSTSNIVPNVQDVQPEISPFAPGTTGNMFDTPSGMSL